MKEYFEEQTAGGLLKFIQENNIPDSAGILSQRVHDVYFDKYGWSKSSVVKEDNLGENEYHPIWCPVKYPDDDNLYLDLHY